MAEHILTRELTIDLPRSDVFDFFSKAENLQRITPPELGFQIITPQPFEMGEGSLIDYRISLHGIPMGWKTLISKWDPPNEFVDEQILGPYKQWIHRHTFVEAGPSTTLIKDEVRYRLPLEPFGDVAHLFVERQLNYIFDFREKTVNEFFRRGGRAQAKD